MSTETHSLTDEELAELKHIAQRAQEHAIKSGNSGNHLAEGVDRLLATVAALQAENKAVHANYSARLTQVAALDAEIARLTVHAECHCSGHMWWKEQTAKAEARVAQLETVIELARTLPRIQCTNKDHSASHCRFKWPNETDHWCNPCAFSHALEDEE